jgi:thioesterase domain-containing protein
VRPIGVRDNYFELGGHSLSAVKVMNRIEEAFGKTLPIATLLTAPTIEQLAEVLRRNGSSPWSCLVPIQTSGSKPPFFCMHGINGAVVRFHDLSKHLGPDQPFYGLQAQGLDAAHACHTRTEDMAAHYIKEIRRVQPHGPYFLGGYSFGGAIAFEMAQQLAEVHEDAVVVLFDTNFPQSAPASVSPKAALLTPFRVPAGERWDAVRRILRAPIRMLEIRRHVAGLPEIVKKVRQACMQAENSYRPQVFSGRVILFQSNHKPLGQLNDPRAGWKECAARGLEIYEIAGNHENLLLEPQVRFVAERMKACLDQAVNHQSSFPKTSALNRNVN